MKSYQNGFHFKSVKILFSRFSLSQRIAVRRKVLVVFLMLLSSTLGAQPSRISDVKSWAYQLQNISIQQLSQVDYDLIVMDYSIDGTEQGRFSSTQIESVKSTPRKVLAYMSIGEAEDYRFYWQESWDADRDGKPDANSPVWLTRGNPDWIGNYKVRYWDTAWQRIIFGTDTSYLDKIIADGYNGVYLDIVDAYYYFGEEHPEPSLQEAARRMIDFVKAIANYARVFRGKSDFIIVAQNASGIIEDVENDDYAQGYLGTIDGIGTEDTFFRGKADQDNPYNPDYYVLNQLNKFSERGKKVLAIDYIRQPIKVETFYTMCVKNGYIPYATIRELDSLITNIHPDTTYRYHTFTQEELTLKAVWIPSRGPKPIPNAGNVRDLAFNKIYYPQGLVLGVARTDSPKAYGWIRIKRGSNAQKFLQHSAPARGFDYIGTKLFVKELRNPRLSKYDNHLVGELLTLRTNIAASDADIIPPGFGNLIYDDGDSSNQFNGWSLRQIADYADSVLTFWRIFPFEEYISLDSILLRANRAFSGSIDADDTVSVKPLRLRGKKGLNNVQFLKENSETFRFHGSSPTNTIIEEEESEFSLFRNYPNPFNPTTTIRFELEKESPVTLNIYNALGQLVEILIKNETFEAGINDFTFDASHLPSGVYYLTIETREIFRSQKIILLK